MLGSGSVLGAVSVGARTRPTTARSVVTVMDAISEAEDLGAELSAGQTNVGLGTNPLVEPSTPRSTKLPK